MQKCKTEKQTSSFGLPFTHDLPERRQYSGLNIYRRKNQAKMLNISKINYTKMQTKMQAYYIVFWL